jgi:hypothetical protein
MTTKCIKFGDLTAKNINVAGFRDANWSPNKTLMLTLPCLLMRSICSWKTSKLLFPCVLFRTLSTFKVVLLMYLTQNAVAQLFEAPCYKPEGCRLDSRFFFFQCHHMSLMDFVVSLPYCGRRVTDVWGCDAHEAQLRFPDEVDGDIWIWSTRRGLKPKFY